MGPAGAGRRGTRYKQKSKTWKPGHRRARAPLEGRQLRCSPGPPPSPPSFSPSSPPGGPSSAGLMCEVRGHPTPSRGPE